VFRQSPAAEALSYISTIAPYQPGKPITELARQLDIPEDEIIKLASNENPLGMSPLAHAEVSHALADAGWLSRYPDNYDLTQALAQHFQLSPEQIVLGNGSNDVLDMVARVFLSKGRSCVYSAHAFAVYALASQSTGAECIVAAADKNFGHDLAAMKVELRSDTAVVWIANPNNPTGTYIPHAALYDFITNLPEHVIVVVDQAYNEYLPIDEQYDSIPWLDQFPNLVITRTFSKIYGLAGQRVGYAMTSANIADLMHRVRQPFNVNNLALLAAEVALRDKEFISRSLQFNQSGKSQILSRLKKLALPVLPAYGNFVTFAVEQAEKVNQLLLKQGVIIRGLAGYQMPGYLRVSIGLPQEIERFFGALENALTEVRG